MKPSRGPMRKVGPCRHRLQRGKSQVPRLPAARNAARSSSGKRGSCATGSAAEGSLEGSAASCRFSTLAQARALARTPISSAPVAPPTPLSRKVFWKPSSHPMPGQRNCNSLTGLGRSRCNTRLGAGRNSCGWGSLRRCVFARCLHRRCGQSHRTCCRHGRRR